MADWIKNLLAPFLRSSVYCPAVQCRSRCCTVIWMPCFDGRWFSSERGGSPLALSFMCHSANVSIMMSFSPEGRIEPSLNSNKLLLEVQASRMLSPLLPFTKECNYGIRGNQTSSNSTKFIVNSINTCISK